MFKLRLRPFSQIFVTLLVLLLVILLVSQLFPAGANILYAAANDPQAVAPLEGLDTPTSTATNTPTNTATTTNTPTQTSTATPTATRTPIATPIYADRFEPNNSLQTAQEVAAGNVVTLLTLWPVGDLDYFRFVGKAGSAYQILTRDLDAGLDTFLSVYDTNGNLLGTNDDFDPLSRASQVTISANVNGFYYISVSNLDPSNPADKTYNLEIVEILGTTTPTAYPTGTRVPTIDECEDNSTFERACVIEFNKTYNFDFVPVFGDGPDNDFFRVWIKVGWYYTCETLGLSSLNDTNMIFYYGPSQSQGIAGNDDKAPNDLGSKVSFLANYTGWLYVLVGPYASPEYPISYLYTYSLKCDQIAATPTPTPSATFTPAPVGSGGGGGFVVPTPFPTPTPFVFVFPATPTPLPPGLFQTPIPTPRPIIQILPLPTATPAGGGQQSVNLNFTLYYDINGNFQPELTEGIMNVTIYLYDNSTGQLLAIGYTNEAGNLRIGPINISGPVRVVVPFLTFSQIITGGVSNIMLRIAPQPLPGNIP